MAAILLTASAPVMNAQAGAARSVAATPGAATAEALPQAADPSAAQPAVHVLGYVFDGARRTIHAVLGTIGTAQVGDALPSRITPSTFVAAAGRDYGLAVEAASGAAFFLKLAPSAVSESRIGALNDGADRIVVSPSGSAAAFYDRQSRSVQIVQGLPETRRVSGRIQLDSLDGLLTAMAVNDAGDSLLVGLTGESGGGLYLTGASRNPRKISAAGRVASVAFLPESNDAVMADYDRNEVVLIRSVGESGGTTVATTVSTSVATTAAITAGTVVLGGERDGIRQPASIGTSRDGLSVYVISGRRHGVTRLTVAGGAPSSIDCDCTPDRLGPLAGNAVFGLTAASDSPLYIYDGDRETDGRLDPRIVAAPSVNPAKLTQPKPERPLRLRRGRTAR